MSKIFRNYFKNNFPKKRFPEWPGLNPDQDYFIRLSATNNAKDGPMSFAQFQFRIHSLPNIEKLLVTPADSIASLDTLVRIQPSGQFTNSSGHIYRIRFGIRYLLENTNGSHHRDIWSKRSMQSELDGIYYETMLPTGEIILIFFGIILDLDLSKGIPVWQ